MTKYLTINDHRYSAVKRILIVLYGFKGIIQNVIDYQWLLIAP